MFTCYFVEFRSVEGEKVEPVNPDGLLVMKLH